MLSASIRRLRKATKSRRTEVYGNYRGPCMANVLGAMFRAPEMESRGASPGPRNCQSLYLPTHFNESPQDDRTILSQVLAPVFEAVAYSSQRFKVARMARIGLDFLAQATDENIDGARGYEGTFFPNGVEQLIAGKHASPVAGQVFEQTKFPHRGKDRFSSDAHSHRSHINFNFAQVDRFVAVNFRRNAENVAHPGNQFTWTERLGDVTIASEVEGLQPVRLLSSRRKKNNGSLGQLFVLADLAAQIEAADSGKHDVEQKQRGLNFGSHGKNGGPGKKCGNLEASGAQVVFDELRDVEIILDNVDQIGIMRFIWWGQSCHFQNKSLASLKKNLP